jgi:hypothetical protein
VQLTTAGVLLDQLEISVIDFKQGERLPLIVGDLDELPKTVVANDGTASARRPRPDRTNQLYIVMFSYLRKRGSLTVPSRA